LVQDAANLPACYALVLSGTSLYVTNNNSGLPVSEISTLTGSITPVISGTGHTFSGITAIGSVLYLTDTQLHNVYSAAIGSFSLVLVAGNGSPGYSDATGSLAAFNGPNDVTHDGTDLFLSDNSNHAIRRITPGTGAVTTVILGGVGYQNSVPGPVQFNTIRGIVSDGANLFLCDRGSNAIRKIQ
jgi:streptogramin lyase